MALWTEWACVPFPVGADLAETLWPYRSLVSARPPWVQPDPLSLSLLIYPRI